MFHFLWRRKTSMTMLLLIIRLCGGLRQVLYRDHARQPSGPERILQNSVQIHAASAEAAGKMTSSFSSWLLRLKPYLLPLSAGTVSG